MLWQNSLDILRCVIKGTAARISWIMKYAEHIPKALPLRTNKIRHVLVMLVFQPWHPRHLDAVALLDRAACLSVFIPNITIFALPFVGSGWNNLKIMCVGKTLSSHCTALLSLFALRCSLRIFPFYQVIFSEFAPLCSTCICWKPVAAHAGSAPPLAPALQLGFCNPHSVASYGLALESHFVRDSRLCFTSP